LSFAAASLLSLIGLVGLTLGAEWLVRGASRLAAQFGISSLAIGLTVVAYGTSAPEILASLVAAAAGYPEMTVGNVLGSNIANVGLILGATATLAPLAIASSVLRRELPFMIGFTVLFAWFASRLEIGRGVGLAFIGLLIAFNTLSLRWARGDTDLSESPPRPGQSLTRSSVLTMVGLGLLLGGAQLLVGGAVSIARSVGLSEFIIGVTLVAIGTSLPELATSIVAGLRGQTDLVIGAIVGSNVFNILAALGLSAIIQPIPIDPALVRFEFPALIAFTVVTSVFLYTGKRLVRWEGVCLVVGYIGFIALVFR
jgi:cation:H+ antiporter